MKARATNRSRRNCVAGEGGFSMIELMVVIVIIGMLAALVGVNVIGNLGEAEVNTAKAQIQNLKTALMSYRLEFKKFPDNLDQLVNNSKNKTFLDPPQVPKDPWGNDYVYKKPGPNGAPYEIVCYGSDGSPGGTDTASDISSADLSDQG